MDDELKWVIGLEVSLAMAFLTVLVAGFYRLSDSIRRGDDVLHARVNTIRDEYVRRSDLDNHLSRIEVSMRDIRAEMKEQHRDTQVRLDVVLAAVKREVTP